MDWDYLDNPQQTTQWRHLAVVTINHMQVRLTACLSVKTADDRLDVVYGLLTYLRD